MQGQTEALLKQDTGNEPRCFFPYNMVFGFFHAATVTLINACFAYNFRHMILEVTSLNPTNDVYILI